MLADGGNLGGDHNERSVGRQALRLSRSWVCPRVSFEILARSLMKPIVGELSGRKIRLFGPVFFMGRTRDGILAANLPRFVLPAMTIIELEKLTLGFES